MSSGNLYASNRRVRRDLIGLRPLRFYMNEVLSPDREYASDKVSNELSNIPAEFIAENMNYVVTKIDLRFNGKSSPVTSFINKFLVKKLDSRNGKKR